MTENHLTLATNNDNPTLLMVAVEHLKRLKKRGLYLMVDFFRLPSYIGERKGEYPWHITHPADTTAKASR